MQLKPFLPELPPRIVEGGAIYGPIPHAEEDVPIASDLVLAAEEIRDTRPQHFRWDHNRKYQDNCATNDPEEPVLAEARVAIAEVIYLFSPIFWHDAPYDYYLCLLRESDLHYVYMNDTNAGALMLGFIDGGVGRDRALRSAVGLLMAWFAEYETIGPPEAIWSGELTRAEVERILRASPNFNREDFDAMVWSHRGA